MNRCEPRCILLEGGGYRIRVLETQRCLASQSPSVFSGCTLAECQPIITAYTKVLLEMWQSSCHSLFQLQQDTTQECSRYGSCKLSLDQRRWLRVYADLWLRSTVFGLPCVRSRSPDRPQLFVNSSKIEPVADRGIP